MTRAARIATGVVMSLAGVALLSWQVRTVGLAAIGAGLAAVGFGFSAILALSLLRFAARALAWTTLLGGRVPFMTALRAVIGGDALGNITPFRMLASEPAKALMLAPHVAASDALAALVAENVLYSASVAVAIVGGAAAMLAAFDVADAVRWAGWASLAGMASVLAATVWLGWQQPAMASGVIVRIPFVPPHALAALVTRVRRFEDRTYGFVRGHGERLAVAAAWEAAFHVCSFAETYLTVWLLTGRSLPMAAFVLDTVNRVINAVFLMVPLRMGVAEAGNGIVAEAIGVGRVTGVTMALVVKIRILAWAVVGLALWSARRKPPR